MRTLVYHRNGKIVDIEGNPDSPINGGTLCPKGAGSFQLHVNENRWTTCKYRAPYATEWQDVTQEWMMERIAERFKETRERTFVTTDDQGRARQPHDGDRLARGRDARQRGELLDHQAVPQLGLAVRRKSSPNMT